MRVELLREAQIEIRKAAFWYDEQRQGLGTEFVAAVNVALTQIRGHSTGFLGRAPPDDGQGGDNNDLSVPSTEPRHG